MIPKLTDEPRIFEVVVRLFVLHGYEGATTKEIARAAGVNEATLFRKYGSKAELFERAINYQWSDVPIGKVSYSGDLEADLRSIVDAYLETSLLHGAIVPMLLTELSQRRDLETAFSVAWANIGVVVEIMVRYQSQGLLQAEDPLLTLSALLGPIMVTHMFRRAGLGLPLPEVDAEDHVRSFLDGRRPDRPRVI